MEQPSVYKILVIDDDPSFHKDIRNSPVLRERYEFYEALDADAVKRHLDGGAKFDLVLLDLFLNESSSEKNGMNLILKIKEKFPNMPIVVATNDNRPESVVEASRLGAVDYLFKGDYDPEFWGKTIDIHILNKGNWLA